MIINNISFYSRSIAVWRVAYVVTLLVLEGPQRMAPRVVVKQYALGWIRFLCASNVKMAFLCCQISVSFPCCHLKQGPLIFLILLDTPGREAHSWCCPT